MTQLVRSISCGFNTWLMLLYRKANRFLIAPDRRNYIAYLLSISMSSVFLIIYYPQVRIEVVKERWQNNQSEGVNVAIERYNYYFYCLIFCKFVITVLQIMKLKCVNDKRYITSPEGSNLEQKLIASLWNTFCNRTVLWTTYVFPLYLRDTLLVSFIVLKHKLNLILTLENRDNTENMFTKA